MSDYMIRALAFSGRVRAFACQSTEICREAVRIHDLSPIAAAAMGRLLTGTLMLAADLDRPGDSVTTQIRGDGPLQSLIAIAEQDGSVRGDIGQPIVPTRLLRTGKLDVGGAVGRGTLTVILDLGLKEPYVGQVDLVSGEIAEDLAHYLAKSQQTPSIVSLGVRVDATGVTHAGGILVQLLPDADEAVIAELEQRIAGYADISVQMAKGLGPEDWLARLFGADQVNVQDSQPVRYACTCNRARMERNLIALGKAELSKLTADPDGIELICHFCATRYHFSPEQLERLLQAATVPGSDDEP